MIKTNPDVDWYFNDSQKWKKELQELRRIALGAGLTETLKWGKPCYVFESNNIVLIHDFKAYCALLFFKGALLTDTEGLLVQQTPNVQSARQIRFADIKEIASQKKRLAAYISQAIEVEKSGLKVTPKKTADFERVPEFQNQLSENPAMKKAFFDLTPGRQRGYLLYFAAAKQSKTRQSRVDKSIAQILAGKGLDDK